MATGTRRIIAYTIAGVTSLLGVGSLSLFGLFLWTGSFGLVDMRMAEHAILSWDAGLCLLFFLQHSSMVRKSFRARLNQVLPEHCYGVVYTIASAVALLLLVGCWQRSNADIYVTTGAERWLVRAILLLSLAGVLWGIRSLGEFDAFGIQVFLSHVRGHERHPAKLTIEGPYRLVRHPFYWAVPWQPAALMVCASFFQATRRNQQANNLFAAHLCVPLRLCAKSLPKKKKPPENPGAS